MTAVSAAFDPLITILPKLLLAVVLGGIIGFERERLNQAAGLRTHILVSLAAATFTILTFEMMQPAIDSPDSLKTDPIRVIEAVTAGVAFLAAGAIIQSRGKVRGLTTGAGMWLAGALGVASGAGQWQLAISATAIGLAVTTTLRHFENAVFDNDENETSNKS